MNLPDDTDDVIRLDRLTRSERAPDPKLSDVGEDSLTAVFARKFAPSDGQPGLAVGIGDDCAAFSTPGDQVFTCDQLVEGVHFNLGWSTFFQLGYRTLAAGVSDCAAMGARPAYAVISASLRSDIGLEEIESFADGLKDAADSYGLTIAGGDLAVTPDRMTVSAALIGVLEGRRPVTRSGTRAGDVIAVSGGLGDSAAGLYAFERLEGKQLGKRGIVLDLKNRHLKPRPHPEQGVLLSETGLAGAMMDISDGLLQDLPRLCRASAVGARISSESVPFSRELAEFCRLIGENPLRFALSGGEDFRLLVAMSRENFDTAAGEFQKRGLESLIEIGEIVSPGEGLSLVSGDGKAEPLPPGGFDHFRRAPDINDGG